MNAGPFPTRRSIEDTIERLVAMLDFLDGDADLEAGADAEPNLGWPVFGLTAIDTSMHHDDREFEDENGGDVNDEPQEDGDSEHTLGWLETCGQRNVGTEAWLNVDDEGCDLGLRLEFDGRGNASAIATLKQLRQRRNRT